MSDHMRKMLDELMGTQRDGVVDERQTRFNDSVVCKSFLVGLCPYDLFHNTVSKGTFKSSKKLDLGVCSKVHDPALKADYEQAAKTKEYNYEIEQFDAIRQFVADCERKVTLNKKRLEETQDAESLCPEALAVHTLNEQIGKKLAEAEQLGVEGNIEESMKAAEEVEQLKADKKKAEEVFRSNAPAATNQQQKLRVCDICAAFLSLYDNDRRLADHFGGRLHMGFIQVRERLEELEKMMKDRPDYLQKVEQEKIRERSERSSRSERERSRERSRRRRSRSRDRDSRRKHRSRSHEHRRSRHRRSRSRDRRSHSRDRRSRSRDRRSRERHSRSRDRRSRSRERRSRSRERSSDRREEPKEPSTSDERLNDTMEDGEVVEEANGSPAAPVTKSADEICSKCTPSSMPLDQIPTHNEFDERAAT